MKKIILVLGCVALAGIGVLFFVVNTFLFQGDEAVRDTRFVADESTYIETEDAVPEPPKQFVVREPTIIDSNKLPLGDGRRSTSPQVGSVFSCQTAFSENAGGASQDGPWINGATWNANEKIRVLGSVSWPEAWFKVEASDALRLLTGNGLPVGSETGVFPIASTDPAYQYDRNPNAISAQDVSVEIPANPELADEASCVPMGAIGRALNGVAIFNALDARGDDAVAHELQDNCNGHPERTGEYHYHGPSDCIEGVDEPNTLVGYALDGFGIYSRFNAQGKEYSNDDLDACHGITSEIEWNGEKVVMYHYVLTQEYPYTIGCFRGAPVGVEQTMGGGSDQARMVPPTTERPGGGPPQEAITACNGKAQNSACSIQTPQGTITGSCKTPPDAQNLACVPG